MIRNASQTTSETACIQVQLMRNKLLSVVVVVPLLACICGCAPSELFSSIDRNCYVADWTNHHSCASCCCCKHGACRRPAQVVYPKLVLGKVSPDDAAIK